MIEEAIPLYNQLIDQNPYSAPYWFGLARCHFEDLNFDQAIDACDYALIGDDEFADAYVMKGHCFYQLGNEDAALECYQKAEQMHGLAPEFVYTYIGLCKVPKRMGRRIRKSGKSNPGITKRKKLPHLLYPAYMPMQGFAFPKKKKRKAAPSIVRKPKSWNRKILKPT